MFGDAEVFVDLQTGVISLVLPAFEDRAAVTIESVGADEPFAPQE